MAQKVGAGLAGLGRGESLYALYDAVDKTALSNTFEQSWADLSGNSRNATRTTQPGTTAGFNGTAIPQFTREGLHFSAVNDCCFSVSRTGFNMYTVGATVLATIRTTDSSSTAGYAGDPAACIMGDSTGGVGCGFGIHNGKVRATFYQGGWHAYDSATSVNDNKWHQIAFTRDAGNPSRIVIYIDGEIDYETSAAYNANSWLWDRIGRGYNIADQYSGYLRNLAVWNRTLTQAEIQDIWVAQGGFNANGRGPYVSAGLNGTTADPRPAKGATYLLGFKYRQIINYAYTMGGYKDGNPWKSVHKTISSTDQTSNLGDQLGTPANYTSGGCNFKLCFMWGASVSHPGTSTNTTCMNMFTDTVYTPTSAMHMVQSRNDCGCVFKEHDFAWISGGGSSNVDKFNYHNETMATSTISGGINNNADQAACSGFSDQHYGYWWVNAATSSQKVTYATDTFAASSQWGTNGQQKGISSKLRYGYAGNEGSYNGGYNLRRWYLITDTNLGTFAKPQPNCGEENFTMGQNHQYMLGNYDGAQNNENWKIVYATDTGTANVAGLSPTAHAGQSSGHCAWRE